MSVPIIKTDTKKHLRCRNTRKKAVATERRQRVRFQANRRAERAFFAKKGAAADKVKPYFGYKNAASFLARRDMTMSVVPSNNIFLPINLFYLPGHCKFGCFGIFSFSYHRRRSIKHRKCLYFFISQYKIENINVFLYSVCVY